MEKSRTAVEFYDQALRKCLMGTVECDPNQILEDAKLLFKEQIKEAYCEGDDNIGAEQYYNQKYNNPQK